MIKFQTLRRYWSLRPKLIATISEENQGFYRRLVCVHPARPTKKIFLWDQSWRKLQDTLIRNNLQEVFSQHLVGIKATISILTS